jgi:hypothetical protein
MRNQSFFFVLMLAVLSLTQSASAQKLKPGFEKAEYLEMLKIAQKAHVDTSKWKTDTAIPYPERFEFVYRSPVVGLDNIWDLWIDKGGVAVISVRGSIMTTTSFLANLYAAMVPAKGVLELERSFHFNYNLSDNPNAAVHVGWLVAMAYLSRDILPKIDSCYHKGGIKEFILTGHSQGGGITFLLTSYLERLRAEHKIPQDIRFKTYCSAGPKPGNLFYAYDYENLTRGGWAFNTVNTADWVPDVPFSIQTVDDFTTINPFRGAKAMIKKQKFPANLALKFAYCRLSKPAKRAQRRYQKYLGNFVSKAVKKQLPEFVAPEYYRSNYYVRTGATVVLYPDAGYYKVFNNDPSNTDIWINHLMRPYLYLVHKMPDTP